MVRLQHLQWVGGLAVAACCLVLGGASLVSSLREDRSYEEAIVEIGRFQTVMAAANAVSAERAPASVLMASGPNEAAVRAGALAVNRIQTDLKIEVAARLLSGSSSEAALDKLRRNLASARATINAVAATPQEERSATRKAAAIVGMFAASDAAEKMRDELAREIIRVTPQISTEITLSTSASTLREYAGRLGSYVVMLLMDSTGVQDDAHFAKLLETKGRLDEIRRTLAHYADAYFREGPVREAIAGVEADYYKSAEPWAMVVAGQGEASIPVARFTENFFPKLQSAERLRETIAAASVEKLEGLHRSAHDRVFASAILTAAVCVILFSLLILFRNSLFRPLIVARDQIVAIARDDLADPVRTGQLSREIGEMFDGLATLRDHQRRRLALEHDQMRMAQQLKTLSETDPLTGLFNRRALEGLATDAIAYADRDRRTIAVLIFDVDHFKSVNDTFGHAVGDLVLKSLAAELEPKLRPGDCLARYGGEEFVVMLPNTSAADAIAVAERLREAIQRLELRPLAGRTVTASFGVALRAPLSSAGWATLIEVADRRLYAAKKAGRNRVVCGDAVGGAVAAA